MTLSLYYTSKAITTQADEKSIPYKIPYLYNSLYAILISFGIEYKLFMHVFYISSIFRSYFNYFKDIS